MLVMRRTRRPLLWRTSAPAINSTVSKPIAPTCPLQPKFPGTVRQLLHKRIRETYIHPQVRRHGPPLAAARGWGAQA